ncbi:MAG: DegT/DnrJ/EryC1/StrS family aminotransferase [Schumannella sp.]
MIVPAATPTRLSESERSAIDAAVRRVVDDGPWIGGPEVEAFEEEFGARLGAAAVVGCASGTDALTLALLALGVAPGETVLVPGHDGGYGATAARLAGLEPVPADNDPVTCGPTVATLEAAGPAAAIIVAHLHGDAVDLGPIDAWRRERGMALIEDCAQSVTAPGSGLAGDASAYSFYPTKNLGAMGDAGAVTFADPEAARRARSLAQYGWGER